MPPMSFREWFWRTVAWNAAPYLPPRRPGRFTLTVTAQDSQTMMQVTATLPEKTANDVAKFTLKYTVNGGSENAVESTGDPIIFTALVGDEISAVFTETDASGNESAPSEPQTLTVSDSIAPPAPGAFNLSVTGQD